MQHKLDYYADGNLPKHIHGNAALLHGNADAHADGDADSITDRHADAAGDDIEYHEFLFCSCKRH